MRARFNAFALVSVCLVGSGATAVAAGVEFLINPQLEESDLVQPYSTGEENVFFGTSTAVADLGNLGSIVVVGATDAGDLEHGLVYVFEDEDCFIERREVVLEGGSEENDDGLFGRAVAVSADGNVIVVGAPLEDARCDNGDQAPCCPGPCADAGRVYVYERDGRGVWDQVATILIPDDQQYLQHFGSSVAISADGLRIAVGAHWDTIGGMTARGSAYVFDNCDGKWQQGGKLTASDPEVNDHFGHSIAISADGRLIVVGSNPYTVQQGPQGGTIVYGEGKAYVYGIIDESSGEWGELDRLHASLSDQAVCVVPEETEIDCTHELEETDLFGADVAIMGNRVVVGAPGDDDLNDGAGSVYVFQRYPAPENWTEVAKFLADDDDDHPGDAFGASVAIGIQERLVVGGAPSDGAAVGSAFAFFDVPDDEWKQVQHLVPSDGGELANYGSSVAIHGQRTVVGQPGPGAPEQACRYTYKACPGDANGDGSVNLPDFSMLLVEFGAVGCDLGADFDGDCCVTTKDFTILLQNWSYRCRLTSDPARDDQPDQGPTILGG
jgi:hypothetical protein